MKSCTNIVAGIVLGVAAFALPIHAENIGGTFDGDATLTLTGTPGVFALNFTGDGDDTTLGAFTPTGHSTIDFSHLPSLVVSDGTISETFADGTLFGTSSGTGTGNGAGVATFNIDFVITGGTGDFAGDTGEAALTGTITQTSPTTASISNGSYAGSITATPEPSTWMLLVTGLAAAGSFRRLRADGVRQRPAPGK